STFDAKPSPQSSIYRRARWPANGRAARPFLWIASLRGRNGLAPQSGRRAGPSISNPDRKAADPAPLSSLRPQRRRRCDASEPLRACENEKSHFWIAGLQSAKRTNKVRGGLRTRSMSRFWKPEMADARLSGVALASFYAGR